MYKALYRTTPSKCIHAQAQRNLISSATVDRIGEKIKGTIFENWFKFWKNVFIDYREMLKDVRTDVKEKPLKTALLLTGFGFLGICSKLNPNEASFRANYVEWANKLMLVPPSCRNPRAAQHLKYISGCYNKDLLRRLNLGIASVIWVHKSSRDCDIYENNCSYLGIKYGEVFDRVLDFGFLGVWWNLSEQMLDYDINL